MTKTMAEVIDYSLSMFRTKLELPPEEHRALVADHVAAALTAAGFGLVADAKREAWDEAVNEADRQWQIGHASAAILKQDNPYRAAEMRQG